MGLIARVTNNETQPIANAHISVSDQSGSLLYTAQTDANGTANLRAASVWPPFPGVVLRRGMNGPSIRQVQERLNELGANPRLNPDGAFGPLTSGVW